MSAALDTTRRVSIALVLLSAGCLLFTPPAPIRVALGFLQFFYLPGLAFLLFLGGDKRPRLDNVFVPFVVSPVVLSLFVLAAHALTGSLAASTRAAMAAVHVLVLTGLLGTRGSAEDEPPAIPGAVVVISLCFAGVVAGACLINDYLLVRSDAWHHASITREILDRGIPPLEPRLPDVPIRYMWFYHLVQASWTEFSGLPLLPAMAFANVASAFAFPYLAARATSLFGRGRGDVAATPLFAIAGVGAASWVLWPVITLIRASLGDVRGWAEVVKIIRLVDLDRVDVIQSLLTPFGAYLANVVHKFLTVTAINISANLFLFCFVLTLDRGFQERSPRRAVLAVFAVVLGTFLFHVITGTVLILTIVAAAVLVALASRLRGHVRPPAFPSLAMPAAAVLAGLVAMPYLRSLIAGGSSTSLLGDYLHVGFRNLLTIGLALLVLLPFSWRAIRDVLRSRTWPARALAAWVVPLLVVAVFVNLPGIAERKFASYLFLLLTLPVAWQILESLRASAGWRRALLSVWVALLFLVPPVLTVRGFVLEKPVATFRVKRVAVSDDERRVFEWIQDSTAVDAVIIETNAYNLMPVRAHRRNFYPNPGVIVMNGYGGEKVERYGKIRKELFGEGPISPASIEYLRGVGQDFYVVLWSEDLARPGLRERFASRTDWFEPAYENDAAVVFRLRRP